MADTKTPRTVIREQCPHGSIFACVSCTSEAIAALVKERREAVATKKARNLEKQGAIHLAAVERKAVRKKWRVVTFKIYCRILHTKYPELGDAEVKRTAKEGLKYIGIGCKYVERKQKEFNRVFSTHEVVVNILDYLGLFSKKDLRGNVHGVNSKS